MFIVYTILYNIIVYCIQPLIWIRLLWRSRRIPSYRHNWLERYGFYDYKNIKSGGIVLHAVSLGETLSVLPLIHELKRYYPDTIITLTSMTPSGLELARQFQSNHDVQCLYLPYDLPGSMKRFINYIKPKLVIIMETELWPNFINILYQYKIPVVIANARLSFYSFIQYKKISQFFAFIMQRITIIAAQHEEDASRFLKLGLKKNQLHIMGNLKFDIMITKDLLRQISILKNTWIKGRLTWIASSTHSGEEILLLEAHKQLLRIFPNLLMILAPRHPERFIDVSNITKNAGFSYIMKSSSTIPTKNTQVIINDTIGELMLLYGISDIAFIGGSLVRHGGHNPLEPAAHSLPLVMGPYTFNFNDICAKLHAAHGLISVTDAKSLTHVLSMLLKNREQRLYHGSCAIKVFKRNRGSLQQLLHVLRNYLPHQQQ